MISRSFHYKRIFYYRRISNNSMDIRVVVYKWKILRISEYIYIVILVLLFEIFH